MVRELSINDMIASFKEAEGVCDKEYTYKNRNTISKNRACRTGISAMSQAVSKKLGIKQ